MLIEKMAANKDTLRQSDMYIEKGDSSESVKYWTEWKSEKLHQLLPDADLFLHTTIAWSLV